MVGMMWQETRKYKLQYFITITYQKNPGLIREFIFRIIYFFFNDIFINMLFW